MTKQQLLPGTSTTRTVLGERYELVELLGQGGMAEVFEGYDRALRRPIAVKVMRAGLAADPAAAARFHREARAAAALNHPNIIAVHDVGQDGGTPFIVMELVRGETLARALWRDGQMPGGRVAEIGEAAAEALGAAHRAGIIHRDVSPGNIMVTAAGGVKVLDFGIARAAGWTPTPDPGGALGTAAYASPEQARALPLDERSDIYSLGIVMYELLTGRPPFRGESPSAVAYQHVELAPPPIHALAPETAPALEGIVDRCLRKDPAERYQRAELLAADLRKFRREPAEMTVPLAPAAATRPMTAALERPVEPSAVIPAPRRPIRRMALAALAAVVVAGLIGLAFALPALRHAATPAHRPAKPRPTPHPLTAPLLVRAAGSCGGFFTAKITLHWVASEAPSADGYLLYRSEGPGEPYRQIGLLPGRFTGWYADAHLGTGSTYSYVMRATSGSRFSPPSAPARAKTPGFCL